MLDFLVVGPPYPTARYLCAHGAGAGMATPFMAAVATALAERGIAPCDSNSPTWPRAV